MSALLKTLILAIALCVLGYILWMYSGSIRGELAARYDISHGRYVALGVGMPVPMYIEYTQLLKDRYDVELRRVAGCMVNEPLFSYVESYNKISTDAANRKFGHDIFQETLMDAIDDWRLTHPDKVRH